VLKFNLACVNNTRKCQNYTRVCVKHTLRVEITLKRFEIILMRIVIADLYFFQGGGVTTPISSYVSFEMNET
jgi:hypothetical protein